MIPSAPTSTARKTLADLLIWAISLPIVCGFSHRPVQPRSRDLVDLLDREGRGCELIDGTLVENRRARFESFLAAALIQFLRNYTSGKKLGLVSGEQGPYRFGLGLIRLPDVAFISWCRIPGNLKDLPAVDRWCPIWLSKFSAHPTPWRHHRKLSEYFAAGVELAWIIDPRDRTVAVHASAGPADKVLGEADLLDGGSVLPGSQLKLSDLFGELEAAGVTYQPLNLHPIFCLPKITAYDSQATQAARGQS